MGVAKLWPPSFLSYLTRRVRKQVLTKIFREMKTRVQYETVVFSSLTQRLNSWLFNLGIESENKKLGFICLSYAVLCWKINFHWKNMVSKLPDTSLHGFKLGIQGTGTWFHGNRVPGIQSMGCMVWKVLGYRNRGTYNVSYIVSHYPSSSTSTINNSKSNPTLNLVTTQLNEYVSSNSFQ